MDDHIFHYDPLAGIIKLVATEFRIFTGWHHKLVAVEFKFLLAGTIDWSSVES
jgi:hypothetical protein